MDKKSLAFATIAFIIVGAVLFKDTIGHVVSGKKTHVEEPRASLQRPSATKPTRPISPLSKVLAAFDNDSFGGDLKPSRSQSAEGTIIPKPATWPMLEQGRYREILISARNRSLIIASNLGPESPQSKYALYNFVAGIDFILSQPRQVMSAAEGMAYLENLHLRVTRALEDEGVKSQIYKTWRDVSLDATRAVDRMKEGAQLRPDSDVPVNELSVMITKINVRKNSPYIKVKGIVRGEEVDRIEVYRNGIYLFNVLKGRPRKGYIPIFFKYHDGTGIWAIRVVSKNGDFFERRYRFLSYPGGPVNMQPYATKHFSLPSGDWVTF